MAQQLGGARDAGRPSRVRLCRRSRVTRPCRLLDGLRDHADAEGRAVLDVWMSHGDRVDALPPGFVAVGAHAERAARRRWPTRRGASTPCSSTPRSRTRCRASASDRALRARDLRLRGALGAGQHHRRRHRARARAGGQRQGAARAVGRRGFLGGRGAAAPGDRRPAHLRVRRPRPAARRTRATRSCRRFAREPGRARDPRECRGALPRRAAGEADPGAQAQDHRPAVRRGVRGGGAQARGRALARAGHDLPRRDRVGRRARPARRTSSSRTTTSAACPST